MADFCKACSEELFGRDLGELAGLARPPATAAVLCEGCGPIQVNARGRCVSPDCLRKGQPGHGPQRALPERRKAGEYVESVEPVAARVGPVPLAPLTKRLLQAHQLGVRVYCENGHRYLQFLTPAENQLDFGAIDWSREAANCGGMPCKVYGGVEAALDAVDAFLKRTGRPTLLEWFDVDNRGDWSPWEFGVPEPPD